MRRLRDYVRNALRLRQVRSRRDLRVHLGCGDDRLAGFLNVDVRFTSATDVVADLTELRWFAPQSVQVFYSNAFFEHLYRDTRGTHLRSLATALGEQGVCCYIGLPYFKNVAKLYLAGGPGVVGGRFDLYNVYRYTHGDPESVGGWWLQQLHKSLFDEHELADLLTTAGFGGVSLFAYCYPGEDGRPVNIGSYASKRPRDAGTLQTECMRFLADHSVAKVTLGSVQFLPEPA